MAFVEAEQMELEGELELEPLYFADSGVPAVPGSEYMARSWAPEDSSKKECGLSLDQFPVRFLYI